MKLGEQGMKASEGGAAKWFIMIGLVWLGARVMSYVTSEFSVTNKRVVIKVGFIRRNTLEMFNEKIESLAIDQSIFGRIFNWGTLKVNGSGSSTSMFTKLSSPMDFRKAFYHQADASMNRKAS
jgi:uncharacterized membrane protein YdbT with pleckstrin-like domain